MNKFSLFSSILIMVVLLAGCYNSGSINNPSTDTIPNCLTCSSVELIDIDYCLSRTFTDRSVNPHRIYTEKVWHRKDHKYYIECQSIVLLDNGNKIACSGSEVLTYNQNLSHGMGYMAMFKRGFNINDPTLFLNNYNFSVIAVNLPFLQRKAIVASIKSKHQDRPNYYVWIDQKTGLVLKYVEETLERSNLTVMEVTELDTAPDLSNIPLIDPDKFREGKQIDLEYADSEFNFPVYQPIYLPPGFKLYSCEKVELNRISSNDISFFRLKYMDGIQEISIIQNMNLNKLPPYNSALLGNASIAGIHVTHFADGETQFQLKGGNIDEQEIITMLNSLRLIDND